MKTKKLEMIDYGGGNELFAESETEHAGATIVTSKKTKTKEWALENIGKIKNEHIRAALLYSADYVTDGCVEKAIMAVLDLEGEDEQA